MSIHYRAIHAKSPWRKIGIHKTLDSAINGKDGAKALLLKKGRIAEKWEQYGRPLGVFVWDGMKPNGYLLRLSPGNLAQVEMIELPLQTILTHDIKESCSEVEINGYFKTAQRTSPQTEHLSNGAETFPQGVETPQRAEKTGSEFLRDMTVKSWIQQNADGVCEGCGKPAPFVVDDGTPFLEIHHVRRLADGGSDQITNAIALCPNCHRRAHLSRDRDEFTGLLFKRVARLVRE